MKTDSFASRHIGVSEKDIEVMLRKIGVSTLDELIDKTIPANIRLKEPLALPPAMTEYEFSKHIAELAGQNKLFTTYIGMGWYNTITPAVIQRNVFENPCMVHLLHTLSGRSITRTSGSINEFPNSRLRSYSYAIS